MPSPDDAGRRAVEHDLVNHLARVLVQVAAHPDVMPPQLSDRVHDLLLDLDAAGLAPAAPLDPATDEPSDRLPLEAGSRAPFVGRETMARCSDRWAWQGGLPTDLEAECTLAGIALASQTSAREVYLNVPQTAWHDRRLSHIVRVATQIADDQQTAAEKHGLRVVPDDRPLDASDVEGCATRVTGIAEATGEHRGRLVSLLEFRAQPDDCDGQLAARVIAASQAREEIAGHVDALEALGLQVAVDPPGHDRDPGPATPRDVRERLAAYAHAKGRSDLSVVRPIVRRLPSPDTGRSR